MTKRDELYANDAVWAAFYRDGKNLRDICEQFECGVYDLAPWLTAPLVEAITNSLPHYGITTPGSSLTPP